MKYSLIVSDFADPEMFGNLKKAITELYPDFSFERTIREEGGAETAVYASGDKRICAEINYATKKVQASSDIPVPELTEYFGLSKYAAKKAKKRLPDFRSPKIWKYVIIPAALFLLSVIADLIGSFPDFSFYSVALPFQLSVLAAYIFAYTLGWIWFIPLLTAAIAAARFKKDKLCKLFTAAVPLLGAVRLCIAYPDMCESIYMEITYIPTALLYSGIGEVIFFLLAIYVLVLPYMAANDIAGSVCERSGGRRPKKLFTALCWTVSAVVSITAVCVTGLFTGIENQRQEAERITVLAEEEEKQSLEYDRIYEEYGNDMIIAAEYSARHRYYDWYNCPEPAMEDVWERLFKSEDSIYSELEYKHSEDGIYIDVVIDDPDYAYHYYIYPDTKEVRYDGKTVYFGGETV